MPSLTCYHFADSTLRDGTPLPAKGETLGPIEDIEICDRGYHGSVRAIDALGYAPDTMVAKVLLHGDIQRQHDRARASLRTNLTDYVEASDVLRAFARKCAMDVILLWNAPDVVVKYLRTGDEQARADAWDAAKDAVWTTADATAGDAARAAGWAASGATAGDAARAAAEAAARNASWAAARAAAWGAVRTLQNRRLVAMLAPLWRDEG